MREVLRKAIDGIKRKPYSFLYDRDVQRAFRHIQSFRDGMDENSDVLSVSVPIGAMDVEKLKILPIPTVVSDKIEFPWFPMEHDMGTVAMEFVDALVKGLNGLPDLGKLSSDEIEKLKEKYSSGSKIKILHMADDHASEDGGVDIVDFVDDIGQIHLKNCSLALIPEVDEFEIVYKCSRCGKEFTYPPALSRADNKSPVCRICGAEEAMIAAGASEEQKEEVLKMIAEHEEG